MIAIHDVLDDRKSEIEFYYSVMVDIDNNTNDTLRTIDNQRFFRIMKSNFLLIFSRNSPFRERMLFALL